MAQSEEHRFVTSSFIDLVEGLSKSELFGYQEADRGGFDFACILERDRSRPLVGQTLTHHAEGIEKDLNWLLFAEDVEIPVYLYSDQAKNVTRIRDTLNRAKPTVPERTTLIRLYSYPSGFDADDQAQRDVVYDILRDQITDDLLMNVLFGRLTSTDIVMFLDATGISGLLLAALESIALYGFTNYSGLAAGLGMASATVRSRVQSLWAAGMLLTAPSAALFRPTQRARIFLKICSLLKPEEETGPELAFILSRLGLSSERGPVRPYKSLEERIAEPGDTPLDRRRSLMLEVAEARNNFGVPVSGGPYLPDDSYHSRVSWIGR